MRRRASFMSLRRPIRFAQMATRARIDVDRHAERLGDAVGGDVVVGRADAAGGEDVGVAVAQRVERRDDLVFLVGHDAHLPQVDAERGQIFGDVADVLVLGAPGQDLVADHQERGGDDLFRTRRICNAHADLTTGMQLESSTVPTLPLWVIIHQVARAGSRPALPVR